MDYRIELGDYSTDENFGQLRALFDAAYGTDKAVKLSPEFLKWQYLEHRRRCNYELCVYCGKRVKI